MSNEGNQICVNPADPASLAVGLSHMNGNLVLLAESVEMLAAILGVAAARTEPALAEALLQGTQIECSGGRRRILDVLAAGLAQQSPPPPAKRAHLKIVGGTEGPEAKAA